MADPMRTDSSLSEAVEDFVAARRGLASVPARASGEAVAEVAAFWASLDALATDPRMRELRASALDRLALGAANEPRLPWRRRAMGGLMAASVAGAAILGGRAWIEPSTPQTAAVSAQRLLENPHGPPRSWRLADGSRVTLDTASAIALSTWGKERGVALTRGSAYFEVAHDAAHPFVVHSGPESVTAVGTAFSVRRIADGTDVAMADGKVRVDLPRRTDGPASVVLSAGMHLRFANGYSVIAPVDAGRDLDWRRGVLTFDNSPAGEVVREMNRYLAVPILLQDRTRAVRISGVFRVDDRQGLINGLSALGVSGVR